MSTRDKVQTLPDKVLLQTVSALSAKENEATVELLWHLGEVEKRRAYVPAGCSSMFNYCTRKLRYSEPAANRRIACARALREFPELAEDLLSRDLSLTTLSLVSGILNRDNQSEVTASIRGKSRREVEEFIAGFRPRAREPREQVKPLMVAVPRKEEPSCGSLFEALEKQPAAGNSSIRSTAAREGNSFAKAASDLRQATKASAGPVSGTETAPCMGAAPAPAFEPRFELKFTIGADTRRKLDQAKLLLSGKHPRGVRMEDVFDEALEALLEKRSPERRLARRVGRERRAAAKGQAGDVKSQAGEVKAGAGQAKGRANEVMCSPTESAVGASPDRPDSEAGRPPSRTKSDAGAVLNRHVPSALRDQVYARDGGRCAFESPAGVRCGERHNLELHHLEPFGKGGAHAAGNLALYCRAHNMHQAVQDYGAEHMPWCHHGAPAS